jgi:hypothetical protein
MRVEAYLHLSLNIPSWDKQVLLIYRKRCWDQNNTQTVKLCFVLFDFTMHQQFRSYGAETGKMILANLRCYNFKNNTRGQNHPT